MWHAVRNRKKKDRTYQNASRCPSIAVATPAWSGASLCVQLAYRTSVAMSWPLDQLCASSMFAWFFSWRTRGWFWEALSCASKNTTNALIQRFDIVPSNLMSILSAANLLRQSMDVFFVLDSHTYFDKSRNQDFKRAIIRAGHKMS